MSHLPKILSGPFSSFAEERYSASVADLFQQERDDDVRAMLQAYRDSGVTQPVTPTYGASARGVRPGKFSSDLQRWNAKAALLTKETFPNTPVWGSIASLLDTTGHNDDAWNVLRKPEEVAKRGHIPQMEALYDKGVLVGLAEAVHDFRESIGLVLAADATGMERVLISFEPTKQGLPRQTPEWIGNYAVLLENLRSYARSVQVDIGLNCGNDRSIIDHLEANPSGTFSAVYPNQASIPHNNIGALFRSLADKKNQRTSRENKVFGYLQQRLALPNERIDRMIALCREKNVETIGLCCGAFPKHVADLAATVHPKPSAGQLQPLEV